MNLIRTRALVISTFLGASVLPLVAVPQRPRIPQDAAFFERIEKKRAAMFEQHRLLDIGGVKPGMVVGEVGAGDGYLTFHLAARVGPSGKVYANDIVEEMALEVIRKRAKEKGLTNVETILGTEEDPRFPKASLDLVFFLNSFHEVRKPVELLENLVAGLKPGAKVIIHEWMRQAEGERGPTGDINYSRQELLDVLAKSPFQVDAVDTSFPGPPSAAFVMTLKGHSASKPPTAAILKELNEMLLNFCYNKPKLDLAGSGMIVRLDSDGTLWRFNFLEISDIINQLEGEAHILLYCKATQNCIQKADGTTYSYLAFSIYPPDRGEPILKLFKDLQASLR